MRASVPVAAILTISAFSSAAAQRPELRPQGYVQVLGRYFAQDRADAAADEFVLRRVRAILDGNVIAPVSFRIGVEFGGSAAGDLLDGYVDLTLEPWAVIRAGKTKPPFGIERLQSATRLRFVERGLSDNLVPNRDLGVFLSGTLPRSVASYSVGLANGVADGRRLNADDNDAKVLLGRVFLTPFEASGMKALRGLGFGLAVSHTGMASSVLPTFETAGHVTFFQYLSSAVADGSQTRISPQAYWYVGPVGVLGDFVRSAQAVANGGARVRVANHGWQVAASVVLTGESATHGELLPRRAFDAGTGAWGALEVALRYSRLDVDSEAFPLVADPNVSATGARAWAAGLNWILDRSLKISLDFEHTGFTGPARDAENVVLGQVQVVF
jgi:phosphate-selective porin OprO/OprP